jgi:ribosomal protein S18 acetylase RimI-like enzyme
MGAELSIRRYQSDDRERVEAVMEAALRDTGAYFEDAPEETSNSLYERYLEAGGEFLVGESDGQIVAMGAFRPVGGLVAEFLDSVPEGAIEIKQMHVAPGYQRRGYGQRILDELQRRAHEDGQRTLLLQTTSLQPAARRFYEANGFEQIARESVAAEGRAFDLVFYRKALSPR